MDKTSVIKLDLKKANFNEWRTQVIGALKAAGVYSHIKSTESSTTNPSSNLTASDIYSDSWKKDDEKAQGILLSSLGGSEGNFVDPENDTAAQIWGKLQTRHVTKMASEVEMKRKILLSLSKSPSILMARFIEEFNSKLHDFEKLGGKITELEKCRTFLSSLDEAWNYFKVANDTREFIEDIDGNSKQNKLTLDSLFFESKRSSKCGFQFKSSTYQT